jgi:hypothetical protein
MAAPIGVAVSQSAPVSANPNAIPHTLTLRVDNDAFDFWRLPYNRPDEEYSSGVKIDYDGGDAPAWSRALFRNGRACTYGVRACRTSRWEIGQDIYSAERYSDDPTPPPGSRRSAGWLYLTSSARNLSASRYDELSLTLGVTGKPSLGEFTQNLVHNIAPAYNRPLDWSGQVPFQAGAIVRYEQRRRLALVENPTFGWDFVPRFGGSVGNVSTEGDVGFQTRFGWSLAHPWLPERPRVSFAFLAGASEKAIARDIFLDNNRFPDGSLVGHEPLVTSGEAGFEFRYQWLTLMYRVQSDSRAYSVGPAWHPWASMVGGVTFVR